MKPLIKSEDDLYNTILQMKSKKSGLNSNQSEFKSINLYGEEKYNLWLEKPQNSFQKSATWGNFYRDENGNVYPSSLTGTKLLPALFLNNMGDSTNENYPLFEAGVRPSGDALKAVLAFYGKDATNGQIKQYASIQLDAFDNISTSSIGASNQLGTDEASIQDNTSVSNVLNNNSSEISQLTQKNIKVGALNFDVNNVRQLTQTFVSNPATNSGIESGKIEDTLNLTNSTGKFIQSGNNENATFEVSHIDNTTNTVNSVKMVATKTNSVLSSINPINYSVNNVKLVTMSKNVVNDYDPTVLLGLSGDENNGSIYLKAPDGTPETYLGLDANGEVVKFTPIFTEIDNEISELEKKYSKLTQQLDDLMEFKQLLESKMV